MAARDWQRAPFRPWLPWLPMQLTLAKQLGYMIYLAGLSLAAPCICLAMHYRVSSLKRLVHKPAMCK